MSWFRKSTKQIDNTLIEQVDKLIAQRKGLDAEIVTLKGTVADLKLKQKIKEEDIDHMVRLKDERAEIAKQKYELSADKRANTAIAKAKDDYRDKLEGFLKQTIVDSQKMYEQVLARLPDVSLAINQGSAPKSDQG